MQADPRGFVTKVSGYGMRDLGTDISTRMEVCMYRTVAHLPPETLLRNEVQDVRWTLACCLDFVMVLIMVSSFPATWRAAGSSESARSTKANAVCFDIRLRLFSA